MENEFQLRIPLQRAVKIAVTFFGIGTLLFTLQLLLGDGGQLIFIGIVFIVIAVIFNSITFILALVDLIQKDRLESFYALCILVANIPIAMGYFYILLENIL